MLEDYDILRAAARIVDGKEAEYVYQRTLEDTLRAFLVMRLGDEAWGNAQVLSHILPDGQEVYTAIVVDTLSTGGNICVQDRRWAWKPQQVVRHVVVARDPFGQFQIAPWSPVGGCEQ